MLAVHRNFKAGSASSDKSDRNKNTPNFLKNCEKIWSLKNFAYLCNPNGVIAQLVEQRTENPCVPGSIPGDTTLKIRELQECGSLICFNCRCVNYYSYFCQLYLKH